MLVSPLRPVAAVLLPTAAAVALWTAAPATAVPLSAAESQVCQYSYDQNWRQVPITLRGTLTVTGPGGQQRAPGAARPGDTVRLSGATMTATLPGWIAPFAFDGGIIGNGITPLPVHGWLALEATNTVEGTTAPIRLDTKAVAHADVPLGHAPTERTAWFDDVVAPIPDQAWTASGGDVLVRQAVGTKMAPIPAGRDGAPIQINGGLFVAAELDASTRLFLDCTTGAQLSAGLGHSDTLPVPLDAGIHVPGFSAALSGGTADWSTVDAQLENPALFRAAAGQTIDVTGSKLRVRLTPEQRAEWLGASGDASVDGTVTLAGDRSAEPPQVVPLSATAVPATGAGDIVLDVPSTRWTPISSAGVDLRSSGGITLRATVGGTTRTLTLSPAPSLRPTAYPFAYVLGPDPRTRFDDPTPPGGGGVGTGNPPLIGGTGGFAPPPVRRPAVEKRTTIKVRTTVLKRRKGKVRIRLTNLDRKATTKGKFELVTRSKYRVGKSRKKRTVTLVATKSFSLRKGRSTTYTVKLTKSATTLLRSRKSLKAKLTVRPSTPKTEKTVTRTLTVKR
jgi:hypothetical protein